MTNIVRKFLQILFKQQGYFYLISIITFLYFVYLDLQTVDYGHHISIAKWYKENWFSLTDLIHGYIDIGNYPPLAHQLLALISFIVPIKLAYYILIFIFWCLLSLYASLFFLEYVGLEKNKYLPALFSFTSLSLPLLKSIFQWGQYTTIIGFSFGFIASYYLLKAIRTNKKIFFLLAYLSGSLLLFSHHLSSLIFFIFFLLLMIIEFKLFLKRLKNLILFSFMFFLLIIIGNYPTIERLFSSEPVPKVEIFHESRMPTRFFDINNWVLSYYGASLLFIPIFPYFFFSFRLKNRINFFKLYIIAIFFLLIGLGRITPLTKIFLILEHWLTYERFSMLSGILFSIFFGFIVFYLFWINEKTIEYKVTLLLIILAYIFINIHWFFSLYKTVYGEDLNYISELRKAERDVINFLNHNVTTGYRYQIFGYKGPIANIYSEVNLPTLETIYFTGRKINWLRNSGFSEINRIGDKDFLHQFLTNKSIEYSIKYVVTFYDRDFYKDFYINLLKEYGWEPINIKFISKDVYYIIWESPYTLEKVEFITEPITISILLRGTIPLLTFVVFIILIILFKYNMRKLE